MKQGELREIELFLEAFERLNKVPSKDRVLDEIENMHRTTKGAKQSGPKVLDLHHCTVPEARGRVDGMLANIVANLKAPVTVQIITGKGRHSGAGGAVLAREIHQYVKVKYADYIVTLEDSPADMVVGELPIRGHFHVTLGKKRD